MNISNLLSKNVWDVTIDGQWITSYGNPLTHQSYGLIQALMRFDPFFNR